MSEAKNHSVITDLKGFVKDYDSPTDILIETTTTCNLACIMCPHSDLSRPKGRMPFPLWKKIIDEISLNWPHARVWPSVMGEPLSLGKNLFTFLEYAKEKNVAIFFNTNLGLLKPKMAVPLITSGIKNIVISVDGADSLAYEKIRVKGSYNKLVENILYLIQTKSSLKLEEPSITLQFIVMEENENQVDDFIKFWEDQDVSVNLKIKPRTGWSDGVESYGIQRVSENQRIPCTWLLRQITVHWDGNVPQCNSDWNGVTSYANINEQSLAEAWENLKVLRHKHLNGTYDSDLCRDCNDWQAGRAEKISLKTSQKENQDKFIRVANL